MKSNQVIQIGIIGTGQRILHVAKNLLEVCQGQIFISAVYDPDPLSIQNARQVLGDSLKIHSSEEDLAKNPSLDWIMIGSPNAHHSRQAILALNAGKNVFCEKPLATSFEDCLRVRSAVEKSGRVFAFGLVLRYSPHYQKIKTLLASGVIGKLISFEFNETLHFNHGGGDPVMAEGLKQTILGQKPPLASVHEGICACVAAFGIDQVTEQGRVIDLSPFWEKAK